MGLSNKLEKTVQPLIIKLSSIGFYLVDVQRKKITTLKRFVDNLEINILKTQLQLKSNFLIRKTWTSGLLTYVFTLKENSLHGPQTCTLLAAPLTGSVSCLQCLRFAAWTAGVGHLGQAAHSSRTAK